MPAKILRLLRAKITLRLLRATFEDFQLAADGLSRKVPPLLHRDSARWHPDGYGCNRMKPKKGQAPPTKKRKEKKVKLCQKKERKRLSTANHWRDGGNQIKLSQRLFVDMLNI